VYEAEAVWDKQKKQTRYTNRRMVGHVDPATGEVVANRPTTARASAPTATRLFAGATHLLSEVADQTGVSQDLETALGPDRAAAVEAFAQFLITCDPCPASRFPLWTRTHVHPLGDEQVSSQRWSEVFASITQDEVEAFFRARIARASGSYWFFDTTSISSYSQLVERVRWGKNKDHQRLPQINLALVKDAGTGAPVGFKDLPGNITDVSLVTALLADFAGLGAGRMKLCMDRGFYSKTNIDALMAVHMKFLIGVKTGLTYVKDALTAHNDELHSWEHYDTDRALFGMRVDYPWPFHQDHPRAETVDSVKRSYLHLYYSPERAVADERDFAALLDILYRELDTGQTLAEHDDLYQRYFRKVRGGWTGHDTVIAAERARHGYVVLLSNDATLDCWAALDTYRAKDQIEKAFHNVKDRLDTRTTRMHTQETLTGKLFTIVTGLILTTEIQHRITAANVGQTMTEVLDELETIEQYHQPGHRPRTSHITQKPHKLYTALGVNPPTSQHSGN
jgi:hypothetical protein